MMKRRMISIAVVFIMLSTSAQMIISDRTSYESEYSMDDILESLMDNPDIEFYDEDIISSNDKISPDLAQKIGIKDQVKVIVLTSDVAELAIALKGYEYRGTPMGEYRPAERTIAAPVIEIDSLAIPNIAALSGVISVFEYEAPTSHAYPVDETFSGGTGENLNSLDWSTYERRLPAFQHKADKAWEMGYMGDGVNIAVIGNGVDFANPDLYGTQARVDDASSPYDGWPIAYDSGSMDAYISMVESEEPVTLEDAWYVDTSDTNSNVTHPINIDGTNDFWRDELMCVDPLNDGANDELKKVDGRINDFELRYMYITQDEDTWYFGFNTYCNSTDVNYGIYIDTDQEYNSGASYDPYGNRVNSTGWDEAQGTFNPANATHLPEYALYFNHTAIEWSVEDGVLSKGDDKFKEVTFVTWDEDGQSWGDVSALNDTSTVNGSFAYSGYAFDPAQSDWGGFVEFSLPRATLKDVSDISVIMFTTGNNVSHAQDSTNYDLDVKYKELDWSDQCNTLTAYVTVGYGFYERFYDISSGATELYPVTTKYVVPPAFYQSEPHFGYHPDENLPLTRIVICDSTVSGVYDTVYVDLDNNKDFSNDKPCFLSDEISYFDSYNAETDVEDFSSYDAGDGFPDISGGMIYFIADGVNAPPYLAAYLERYGKIIDKNNITDDKDYKKYIPGNGNLTAFIGEFFEGSLSGTQAASAIAGQGKTTIATDDGDRIDLHQVVGTAPNSKIIPIVTSGSLFDAWYFAVEGYDGDPSTTFDQAQIASNGFGFGIYSDGWDIYSIFADWVTVNYGEGNTIFTASAGDNGAGYGTVTSPGTAPSVICVGGVTDFSSRVPMNYESGPNFAWGDVPSMSSNGPSALGLPEPDVLAVSRQAFGALPINTKATKDGSIAADIWMGNAVATAYAAGVMGLAYNAYSDAHSGAFPNITTAREILTSTCDDLNYDILIQGAGMVNAERCVEVASNTAGISTDTPYWVPGDFEGTKYEAFVRLMYPGETEDKNIHINNHGSSAADISISDNIHMKTGEFTAQWTVENGGDEFWAYLPNPGRVGATQFGIYDLDKNIIGEADEDLWMNADMVKITASASIEDLDSNDDGVIDYDFWLDVYDWTDLDEGYDLDKGGYTEVNRMSMNSDGTSNVRELRLQRPYLKSHSGVAFYIRQAAVSDYDEGVEGAVWTLTIETYNKVDWSWLTLSHSGDLSLPASGMDLTATITLPDDAPVGSYEGGIYIDETRSRYDVIAESPINYVDDEEIGNTSTSDASINLIDTAMHKVDNNTIANTTVRSFIDSSILNTNTTTVDGEFLKTTTSTPIEQVFVNTTSYGVSGQFIGGTGSPAQTINEYLGIINETRDNMTLDNGGEGNYIDESSLVLFKNGTIWVDSISTVTGEIVEANYMNNRPLNLTNRTIVPGSYTIYINGTPLTPGVNYTLNTTNGDIYIHNLNVGNWTGGVEITADYQRHTEYVLDIPMGIINLSTMDYKGHITANYQYYSAMEVAWMDCEGNSEAMIVADSWTVYKNGQTLIENVDYQVTDLDHGNITFLTPLEPDAAITADYSYYFPVSIEQTLDYGRDIWQESHNAWSNVSTTNALNKTYLWQNFTPTKEALLGFELFIEEKVSSNDASVTIEAWLVNLTGYSSTPATGTYITTNYDDIYEVLSIGIIYNNDIKSGWNIIPFSEEVELDLDQKYALIVKNNNSASYGYNIAYQNADVYSGELFHSTNSTFWTKSNVDLAFRTFNGYIAPGSFAPTNNDVAWEDDPGANNIETVKTIEGTRIYGEPLTVVPNDPDYTATYGLFVMNLTHRYAEEIEESIIFDGQLRNATGTAEPDYIYVRDIEVMIDGVPLPEDTGASFTPGNWFTTTNSDIPWNTGVPMEESPGLLYVYPNGDGSCPYDSSNYITVNYTYFTPGHDIGFEAWDTTDNVMLPMELEKGLLTSCIVKKNGGTLTEGAQYSIDYEEGTILLDPSQQLDIGDEITAEYTYHDKYLINMTTGNFTFADDLTEDKFINASYSHYKPFMDNLQLSVGLYASGLTGWMKDDVMIDAGYELLMDGNPVPEVGNYELNRTSGAITLLKPLFANNTYTMRFDYYRLILEYPMGAADLYWSGRSNVVNGSATIYLNGGEWIKGDNTYWIINNYARLDFNGTSEPLPPNVWIEGTYDWYPYYKNKQLGHGTSSLLNPNTYIVPGSQILYNHSTPLVEGLDYNFTSDTGLVIFTEVMGPESLITATYNYYNSTGTKVIDPPLPSWIPAGTYYKVTLPDWNNTVPSIWNNSGLLVNGTDYIYIPKAYPFYSFILFTSPIPADDLAWAEYSYYNRIPLFSMFELQNGYLIGGSWDVYNNGTAIEQGLWYEILPSGSTEGGNAQIRILQEIPPDWSLNISYSHFRPVSSAYIGLTNTTITGIELKVDNTLLTDDEYIFNPYQGLIEFNNPLLPGQTAHVNYTYKLTTTIPVLINIASDNPSFEFGGDSVHTQELFNNSRINTGYTGLSGSGDWRFFYVMIPEQGLYENGDLRFLLDISWENRLTDINAFVFGKTLAPTIPGIGDTFPTDRYGPYSITDNGGSDETGSFFTTTDGAREIVAPPLTSGLNVIALNNAQLNGTKIAEGFSGKVGTMTATPDEVKIITNSLLGETSVTLSSNMEWEGLGATAAGPSAPISEKNLTIAQDDENWANYPTFEDQLASGSTTIPVEIKDCLIFHVRIMGHTDFGYKDVVDLDLGIFLDGKDDNPLDGKTQVGEFVAMDADWNADEQVKLISPADGTYLIRPFGFTLKRPIGHFDMDITIVQGLGFSVGGDDFDEAEETNVYINRSLVPAFSRNNIELSWNLPSDTSDTTLQGALYIGPSTAPMCLLIPIELSLDRVYPTISSPLPIEGSEIEDNRPLIGVTLTDSSRGELDESNTCLFVDGIEWTAQSSISIEYNDEDAGGGYPLGSISYTPIIPLSDGVHTAEVRAGDMAGNIEVLTWTFTVLKESLTDDSEDTSSVIIDIPENIEGTTTITSAGDIIIYTNTDEFIINGQVEADQTLSLVGIAGKIIRKPDNSFSIILSPEPGENIFFIKVTDSNGNIAELWRTIIFDQEVPEFDTIRFSDGFLTNKQATTITGEMTERGYLTINSEIVFVNSDGTFSHMVNLKEGVNTLYFQFNDLAGNSVDLWHNLTLDTVAPTISLSSDAATVYDRSFELVGTVEPGSEVFINGKRTQVGTRQSGEFTSTIVLSPGLNTIVIEAEDAAGNIAEYRHVVIYDTGGAADTNWAAIGLMISLLVVGLVLGLLFGGMLIGPSKEEPPIDEIPPEDMDMYDEEPSEDTPLEEDMPPEEDGLEDITEEEVTEEDSDESVSEEPLEEDGLEEIPEEDSLEEIPEEDGLEEIPEEEMAEPIEGLEPIPAEEGMPEETPEEVDAEPMPEEESMPEEVEEDPRIAKLKDAFESGKISEELYEKNLAKFRDQ